MPAARDPFGSVVKRNSLGRDAIFLESAPVPDLPRTVASVSVWDSIHANPTAEPAPAAHPTEAIVPLIYDRREASRRASVARDIKSTQ